MRAAALLLLMLPALAWGKPHKKKPPGAAAAHPHAAPQPPPGPPELLFTFDDGPALDKTPKVLDLLDQHHIKAIFFVNGWHFMGNRASDEKARELLRETMRRGHAVGNHTIHHYFLCGKVYSKRILEEVEGNAALIEQATGIRPDLFRTPYGAHCPTLNASLASLGIKPIGWDIDPQDWKVRNAPKIEAWVEHYLKTLRGRNIILFHDVQGETVKALPNILDWLDRENTARVEHGQPPIKVIDYGYLLPKRPLIPPLLDALGRVLIDYAGELARGPMPILPLLAWFGGQV